MKEFKKSINIWRRYGKRLVGTFLWLTVYLVSLRVASGTCFWGSRQDSVSKT